MKKIMTSLMAVALTLGIITTTFAQDTKTPVINKRQQRQSNRVKQGIKSGEVTGKEAVGLALEQKAIQRQEARAKADGNVTTKERAKIHRSQNQASKDIYKAKHNKRDRN